MHGAANAPTLADRSLLAFMGLVLVVGLAAGLPSSPVAAQDGVRLDSYAEWSRSGWLIVDGQRVRTNEATKWKGRFSRIADVPLGDEVRVSGVRQADGSVLAREIDVRPNGDNALFESDVREGTAELEAAWLKNQLAFEPGEGGKVTKIGAVADDGPDVRRVRRLVDRLAPPYVARDRLRVYVIDNKEWNAMAMGNGAIWVFSGIMQDMPDDQLAIVVGHELAHYTHEHSRRQARRGIWTQMAGLAAILSAEAIGNGAARAGVQLGAALGLSALTAGYGRDLEDQADRVGLRYAYEAGYPVDGAPAVWQRFLDKYGQENRVTNFFFSDHSWQARASATCSARSRTTTADAAGRVRV
ncbi:MAG: M48 family metalloprotease [Vicinamibacterales bacterium]